MASTIDALHSGRENTHRLPDGERVAPEATGEVVRGSVGADPSGTADGFEGQHGPAAGEIAGSRRSLRPLLVLSDAVALTAAWVPLALFVPGAGFGQQLIRAAAAIVATLAVMWRAGLYRSQVCALASREAARVVASAIAGGAVFAGCGLLAGSASPLAAAAGAWVGAMLILTLRWRFVRWLKEQRSARQHLRPALLVGTNDDAIALWSMLTEEPELGYVIVGVAGEQRSDVPWTTVPQCVEMADLPGFAARTGADSVIVVAGALPAKATAVVVSRAVDSGLQVQVWPGYLGLSTRRVRFAPVSGLPVFSIEPPGAPMWQTVAKRAIDVVITMALSPLVVPVLVAAAIGIKLEDGGPVFYRSSVLGRDGKPITVLKLRSMVPNASQMLTDVAALNERTGGPLFKATNDPRVTRIGRILRATSIDELPQLWDVLKGTMSLVGPRPCLPHEDARFDRELRRRYAMRPGITGLWQSEARDNPAFSAYHRLDLLYIDNWSLGLDLAILANTAYAVTVRALKAIAHSRSRQDVEPRPDDSPVSPMRVPELATVEPVSPE